MTHRSYEILGIAPAIIDYLVQVPRHFFDSLPGQKHGMQPIDCATWEELIARTKQQITVAAGGSCPNTLKGLSNLGHRCALIGPVGNDDTGNLFRQSLEDHKVESLLISKSLPTCRVLCLIDPEGHRTFRTCMGAASLLSPLDIQQSDFEGVSLVHLEGYGLQNPGVLPQAMRYAKQAGAKISLDLSSHELVALHYQELVGLLHDHVDIVFCNEDEAKILAKDSAEDACQLLSKWCEIAVVSKGSKGCLVGSAKGVQTYPAYPVDPIDTTGAGDFFISGFLHGYLQGKPLADCAHYGAVLGNAVVQVIGAHIPKTHWPNIRKKL